MRSPFNVYALRRPLQYFTLAIHRVLVASKSIGVASICSAVPPLRFWSNFLCVHTQIQSRLVKSNFSEIKEPVANKAHRKLAHLGPIVLGVTRSGWTAMTTGVGGGWPRKKFCSEFENGSLPNKE